MTERVSIPARAFNDRKIKGAHLRVLAALDALGMAAPLPIADLYAETGIEPRELRRLLQDLQAWRYLLIDTNEGGASNYQVLFSLTGQGEKSPEGKSDPGGEKVPPSDPPLGFPPKDPGPQNTPLLIPPNPVESARASRLPQDWQPSDDELVYASLQGLRDIPAIVEDFRDYWHARAGPEARKVSWSKTWKRWCRKAKEDQDRRDGKRGQASRPSADEQRERRRAGTIAAALATGLVPPRARSG